jgi:anti-sigma regulatory factor (Ser/Thr protein kinase)
MALATPACGEARVSVQNDEGVALGEIRASACARSVPAPLLAQWKSSSDARRCLFAQGSRAPRDDVLLLVTELVTNAVRHANAGPDAVVRVELWRGSDFVRVAVSDEGAGFTAEAPLERDQADGWGLALVDRIADRWAVTPTASGTCAWFELRYEL